MRWTRRALDRAHLYPPRQRLREQIQGLEDEARVALRARGRLDVLGQRRFVIFGAGRSGSTLLVSLLDSNPGLICAGELLRVRRVAPRSYIDHRARLAEADAWGFKLLAYHLTAIHGRPPGPFLQSLHRDGFAIIHLTRRHLLAQALSNALARARSVWHLRGDTPSPTTPVHLDLDDVAHHLAAAERQERVDALALADLPHLHVEYERDLLPAERHRATVARIGEFLGVPLDRADTTLRKVVPTDLRAVVTNYDALRAFAARVGRPDELAPPTPGDGPPREAR